MTPMPPACAIAMASRASVTVSIAEETIGRLRRIAAGEARADVDRARHHGGMAGPQQHVVEGEALRELQVFQRRHGISSLRGSRRADARRAAAWRGCLTRGA